MYIKHYFSYLLFALFACLAAASSYGATAIIPPANTYMLAIGACPPWKAAAMAETCKNDVNKMTSVFKQKYGIPEQNIHVVLDDQATYDGVKQGFDWLKSKEKTAANTRAIVYVNVHGALEAVDSKTSKLKEHEMLVLWTKDKPFTVDFALAEKQWMLGTELRDILDSFDNEKIVIIDACYSGAAKADLDAHQPLTPSLDEREAIIVSTRPSQIGHVTDDITMALFTNSLSDAILHSTPNLDKAFEISSKKTVTTSEEQCNSNSGYKDIPKKVCYQTPLKHDPYGLLKDVHFSK